MGTYLVGCRGFLINCRQLAGCLRYIILIVQPAGCTFVSFQPLTLWESVMTQPALKLVQVEKTFGKVRAVDRISLDVGQGEFFSLLGPSGSGKTTLLRIIAGLETPGNGKVHVGGRDVTRLPPYARGIGMVFQDFLLFPHKIVAENITFPLKMQKLSTSQKKEQLDWVLGLVRMEGFENRYPHQLSGGQKQRVALKPTASRQPDRWTSPARRRNLSDPVSVQNADPHESGQVSLAHWRTNSLA
mgnify:CR=1 FL=1